MRRRSTASRWLLSESRFVGVSQATAGVVLAAVAACVGLMAVLASRDVAALTLGAARGQTDSALYAEIIEAVRHGTGYYAAAAEAMRGGGYPLHPFFTMRLPTLAVVSASLPTILVRALLGVLVIATILVWDRRLAPLSRGVPVRAAVMAAALAGMVACLQSTLVVFHEAWAGLFIALSLGCRRPGRWIEAVAFGLAAVVMRETAAPYLAVMMMLAIGERRRDEAIGWMVAIGLLAVVMAAHAHAVAQVVGPLDPVSPGWADMPGIGFVMRAVARSSALTILPSWIAAPVATLAIFGWVAWRDSTGSRVAATLIVYVTLLAIGAGADAIYGVLLVTPIWLLGLVFAVDALRDLTAAAFDARRITVRRIVR